MNIPKAMAFPHTLPIDDHGDDFLPIIIAIIYMPMYKAHLSISQIKSLGQLILCISMLSENV